ncbi:hypothetical protein [Mesorhizobium sp. M0618]|uniref:hypothetical protein n=1 Tax=unclassified Mesorhizobium TaxID=325217 RepID=UPI00333A2515
MQLELEDLETDFAASVPDLELPIVADSDKVRVLPLRKLNPNLPRKRVVREPSCACCPGGGGDLRAPAPAKAIARGKLSYAALAHIMMAKWAIICPTIVRYR